MPQTFPTLLPGSLCRGERRHLDDLVTVSGRTQDAWCWLWARLECRTHPLAGHLEHTQTPLERKGTLQCLGTSEVRVLLPQFQFGWRCSLGKTFCPPDSSSGGDDLVRQPWHRWGVTQYDPYPGSPVQNKDGQGTLVPRHKCSDGHREIDAGLKLSRKDVNGPGKVII